MKYIGIIFTGALFLSTSLLANEEAAGHAAHHVPSMADLTAPYINFIVLFSFIIYKIKTPLKNHFETKARNIETRYFASKDKLKEINDKINLNKVKLDTVHMEVKSIVTNANDESDIFAKNLKNQTIERVEKLKKDSHLKIEAEKNQAVKKINEELVNMVITNAHNQINSNKDFKNKISNKLIKAI
ncbi:MAG: ATP synthase F0 subunit B [Bacteriovoracaceae bacterium]